MHESKISDLVCAASSVKPFILPESFPHYVPDRPFELQHIRIEVTPDFERAEITGNAQLRLISKRKDIKKLTLDAAELEVHSVRQGDAQLEFEQSGGKLVINLISPSEIGSQYEISIGYHGHPERGLYFRMPSPERPDRPVQLWTQGEDELSHFWFPCIDTPAQKVTSEVIAEVPENMVAVSNGKLVAAEPGPSGRTKIYHWSQGKPHSIYLISLVVGEYVKLGDMSDGVPIEYYVYKGREEDARRSFSETPRMMKFFEEKTGMKYPWDKYAQVVVSDFIFGGMENTSATTLTDTTLHDERAHIDFSSVPLVAHELAHMWFGDLLTCRHWSHAWLNESFATFFEALYEEFSKGRDEYIYALMGNLSTYLEEYEKHYARPIVTNIYENPSEVFDRHLYEKGSLVLNMLRNKLGDSDFFRSIQRYVMDNAFGIVESSDLARAVERTTGINLDEFFDQWLHRPGHPEVSVSLGRLDGSGAILRVRQKQEEDAFKFDLKVVIDYGDTREEHQFVVLSKDQSFYLPLKRDPEYLSLDPDFTILGTVEFERPLEMMLNQIERDAVTGRISAAKGLAREGSLSAIKALKRVLLSDPFWGVRAECARALGEIGNEAAQSALLESMSVEHPKARRAVVQALGKFRKESVARALADRLEKGDPSYFVEAELARSLGKTKQKGYDQLLKNALSRPSHNEVIQIGALDGLSNHDNDEVIELLRERTSQKYIPAVRYAATMALGKVGSSRKDIHDLLVSLLKDEWFRVRSAAAQALVERKDLDSIGDLEAAVRSEGDGRVRRSFYEAISSLRSLGPSNEIKQFREDLEKLREENRLIRERLERLEGRFEKKSSRRRSKARRTGTNEAV